MESSQQCGLAIAARAAQHDAEFRAVGGERLGHRADVVYQRYVGYELDVPVLHFRLVCRHEQGERLLFGHRQPKTLWRAPQSRQPRPQSPYVYFFGFVYLFHLPVFSFPSAECAASR